MEIRNRAILPPAKLTFYPKTRVIILRLRLFPRSRGRLRSLSALSAPLERRSVATMRTPPPVEDPMLSAAARARAQIAGWVHCRSSSSRAWWTTQYTRAAGAYLRFPGARTSRHSAQVYIQVFTVQVVIVNGRGSLYSKWSSWGM